MKKLLLGTTLLAGLAGPAFAVNNTIAIDDGAGTVGSLAIIQDATNASNTVSANGSANGAATPLAISGPWSSIAITQTGPTNKLKGTSIVSDATSTSAALTASYTTTSTGKNTHTLNIGGTTAPVNPALTFNVTNNGATDNVITDTIDGSGTLTYGLTMTGAGNSLTNTVTATTGAISLTQAITGSTNSITNTVGGVTPVTSFTQALTVTGSHDTISTTVDGTGAAVANVSITGGATLGSYVDYALTSVGGASSSDAAMSAMGGTNGTPDKVRVEQTVDGGGSTATLSVAGGGFALGNLSTAGIAGASLIPGTYSASGAGVAVYQNSSGAYLNASVTGGVAGYTALFKQ